MPSREGTVPPCWLQAPGSHPREGQVRTSGTEQRGKERGRERALQAVLDQCGRLKYLEGVKTKRREDLFREPQGRIIRK